ncbi:MAG: MFS transporter, partial [Bacteroidales bacterium]|nr:MFS transporter [Bacteroidales bacterium]
MAVVSGKSFNRSAAWIALACLVVPMFASYYFDDMFSSISYLFENPALTQLGWDAAGYGLYTSGYSVLCVFGGLVVCGVLLDKWGVRITGSIFVGMMAAGAGLVLWALLSGSSASLTVAYVGCMFFGLGSEIAGTAVTRSIAKWFRGGPMALAMGLQLAIARLGTAFALVLSPILVRQQAGAGLEALAQPDDVRDRAAAQLFQQRAQAGHRAGQDQ